MKSKTVKNVILPWTLLVALVLAVVILNKCAAQSDIEQLENYPKTCGYFFETRVRKSGSYSYFRYMVNNKIYEINGGSFDPRNLGNYYSIAYDSTDPGEGAIVDWSEQWIRQDINNISVFAKNVLIDSVPRGKGWRKITFTYSIDNKEYEGTRALKEKFYKRVNLDSLQCCVNPYQPKNSYLYWPGEEPHFLLEDKISKP